jgi:hypothetical protein
MKVVVICKQANAGMPTASWLTIRFRKSTVNRLSTAAAAG